MTDTNSGAYSMATKKHYDSWEELVTAESNGHVAVAIISTDKEIWPWLVGPYADKADAEKAKRRLYSKWRAEVRRGEHRGKKAKFFVRPAWKTTDDG